MHFLYTHLFSYKLRCCCRVAGKHNRINPYSPEARNCFY